VSAVSVILPAFNEAGNVPVVVARGLDVLPGLVEDFELIVVDDGSFDGTGAAAAQLAELHGPRVRLVPHPCNLGYGAALRSGIEAARGDLILLTDADNQFDLADLAGFLPLMAGCDVALGWRIGRSDPLGRSVVSAVYNALVRAAFSVPVRDVNCSFKLWRGPALRALAFESDDFLVDLELVARAQRGGLRLVERGVAHHPRLAGESTVAAGDVRRTLRAMLRLRRRLRDGGGATLPDVSATGPLPRQRI